ncbi:MAG TPA: ABC transporter substrate-binding protein, partial [Thiobacillus sp.]|nr:ABC transporter substrate-binding protein [Thiobacillus sp.]
IYLNGQLPSGEPVRATVQKGVALEGAAAACVNCHRRSGLGGSEGQNPIRPIAGRLLFSASPTEFVRRRAVSGTADARPAYTRASLARVLREGVDPTGRVLDALMPRYALGDDEIDQLQRYLDGLSATPAPGVSDHEIHFATIIAPGVDADRRRAQRDVLQAFFRDKNGNTRKEARRRDTGSEQMYLAYRTWVLHVWELDGAPETWHDQLAAHYREQPVFAVIGGLGSGSWQPVHAFCEGTGVPCVLPDVDYPVAAGAGYYALYFSRGIALEADVLARQLAQARSPGRIVQVFRDDATGRLPAQALRSALKQRGIDDLADYPVSGADPLSSDAWSALLRDARPATLVVWLPPADVQNLAATGTPPAGLQAVYLSASLFAMQHAGLADGWLDRLRMVYPFALPANRARHLARLNVWLRARNIALADARTQANAYFAATVTGDALAHIGENFSRDYFIERIEQMAETALSPSIYPRLSLGPGQRFASRGGYIVGFPRDADGVPVPVSDWLVP